MATIIHIPMPPNGPGFDHKHHKEPLDKFVCYTLQDQVDFVFSVNSLLAVDKPDVFIPVLSSGFHAAGESTGAFGFAKTGTVLLTCAYIDNDGDVGIQSIAITIQAVC